MPRLPLGLWGADRCSLETSDSDRAKNPSLGFRCVRIETRVVLVGGPKPRAVLAVLIANDGQVVSAETLVQAVYGADAPVRRRRAIQTCVVALRSEQGDAILKQGAGWTLAVDPDSVDTVRFERLVDSAKHLNPDAASDSLRQALARWQGHPYREIEAHGHLDPEVVRLDEPRERPISNEFRGPTTVWFESHHNTS